MCGAYWVGELDRRRHLDGVVPLLRHSLVAEEEMSENDGDCSGDDGHLDAEVGVSASLRQTTATTSASSGSQPRVL